MSYGTVQAEKMTTESGYSLGAGNASSFKNRLINGAMDIDQRNAGGSVTISGGSSYTLDRWGAYANGSGVFSVQRSSVAPAGFNNSCLLTVTTADASVTGTDYYLLSQFIEGFNFADMNFGTANAKTVTISFWVRSSITGTFGGCLRNNGGNYNYPFQYVINSANTWEQKSVTISGATAGTWLTTNGLGAALWFSIGTGSDYTDTVNAWNTKIGVVSANSSTNLISTNGATFYITGVQLEVGTVATSFDVRPYPTELALCQRYYSQLVGNYSPDFIVPNASYVNYWTHCWQFPQVMRAAPTVSQISGTTIAMDQFGIGPATVSSNQVGSVNQYYVRITVITSSPSSADPGSAISPTGTFWQASAEL